MPVYHSMQWLATRWTGVNQSVEHFDLVRLPDGAGGYRYGIFSQPEGEGIWKEELSEGEALARLQTWVDEERSAAGRPHSQVTPAGRKWLASVT